MLRKLFLLLFVFLFSNRVFAAFDYNANCIQAYRAIISLKLKTARVLLDQEKAVHPKNGITILLDNYYDYFYLLTTESKADFDRLKTRKAERLDLLADEDTKSPYYNFALAEVNLQWALLHSRFAEYTAAGLCINRAYRQLQNNQKAFPAFLPDDIPLGVVNVLLGVLPDGALKSALSFFGIRGNTGTGVNMLQNLTVKLPQSGYAMYYSELIFYLTYIQADVVNDSSAYAKMLQYTAGTDTSLLKSYVQGYTALRTGHSADAIEFLQNRPAGGEYQPYPYLDYLQGIARMNVMDVAAVNYFNKFLRTNTGSNYIKDAYLHLAWQCLLQGDTKRYQAFVQLVKTKGSAYIEKDKQALTEANEGMPDHTLLQARLYYDGGLYTRALAVLKDKSAGSFTGVHNKTEYYYRLGRIYEAQQRDEEAMANYQQVINTGQHTPYYFAAAAAVKMGSIYERHKNNDKAIDCYKLVSSFKNSGAGSSYEQKAKQALKRLKA